MSLDFCSFTETDACQIWGTCPQQCQSVLSEQMKRPNCSCSVNYTSGYLMNTNIHTCYAKGNMLSWYTKVVALLKIMNMLTLCFKNNFPHHLAHKNWVSCFKRCINLLTGLKPDILLAHETEIIKAGVGKGGGEKPLNINEVCLKICWKKNFCKPTFMINDYISRFTKDRLVCNKI